MSDVSIHPSSVDLFVERLHVAFLADDSRAADKAAEADNVARLQEQYRAIARGDLAAVVALMADDVELELLAPSEVPISGSWRGRDAVLAAVQANYAALADQQAELHLVVAQGDMVVLVAQEGGRVRATGSAYHLRWVQVYTLREGKIVRVQGVAAALP